MKTPIASLAALTALAVTASSCLAPTAQAGASAPPQSRPQAAIVLHDQNDNASGYGTVSQKFETAFAAWDSRGADDFTVPAGQTWVITEVDVTGFYSSSMAKATSENVTFYKNKFFKAMPGAEVTSVTRKGAGTSGSFVISGITGVSLPAGHYWVSVQANMSHGAGYWGWESRTGQSRLPAVWKNPGDAFGTGCTAWANMQNCSGATGRPDFMFTLRGTD